MKEDIMQGEGCTRIPPHIIFAGLYYIIYSIDDNDDSVEQILDNGMQTYY